MGRGVLVMPRRRIIPYNPRLKLRARELRQNATLSEILLWQQVKGKKLLGFHFQRQRPVDHYIVDFFCSELMLAIEIDGITHDTNHDHDRIRQARLESLGLTVLRFLDLDVKTNLKGVIAVITDWIERHTPPSEPEVHQAPLSRGD